MSQRLLVRRGDKSDLLQNRFLQAARRRETTRTSGQSERQVRGGSRVFAQLSGLGCVGLGTEGPEFKSRQPDQQCAGQAVFLESAVSPVVALGA